MTGSDVQPFGERLRAAMDVYGPVCVGIDPHAALLDAWGLPDSVEGLREFALRCVEAFGGRVAAVKPQSAFFERFGSRGVAVLEEVLSGLRAAGTVSILDVKRGDIGSTMGGYAQAYLAPGAPAEADSITVSPYLGYESLRPAIDVAIEHGKGVFALALTSNPEGASVQHVGGPAGSVAGGIVAGATADNAAAIEARGGRCGPVGLVVGATIGDAAQRLGLRLESVRGVLLAPGVGAQGAGPAELSAVFGQARENVLASTSRQVLGEGPDPDRLRNAYDVLVRSVSDK